MVRSRPRWLAAAGALWCLTVSACHPRTSVGDVAAQTSWNGSMMVRVVNHNWLDITIYLLQGTHRDRIGVATAASTTQFRVPIRQLAAGGEYRLLGDPVGSRQVVRSEPLHAQDGDVVTWTLEDDLARSSIDVR